MRSLYALYSLIGGYSTSLALYSMIGGHSVYKRSFYVLYSMIRGGYKRSFYALYSVIGEDTLHPMYYGSVPVDFLRPKF